MVDRVEAILAAEERSREQMARQFDSFSNLVSHKEGKKSNTVMYMF